MRNAWKLLRSSQQQQQQQQAQEMFATNRTEHMLCCVDVDMCIKNETSTESLSQSNGMCVFDDFCILIAIMIVLALGATQELSTFAQPLWHRQPRRRQQQCKFLYKAVPKHNSGCVTIGLNAFKTSGAEHLKSAHPKTFTLLYGFIVHSRWSAAVPFQLENVTRFTQQQTMLHDAGER